MKKLITAREVQECKNSGKTKMVVDKNTIITPAARDAAMEKDVVFILDVEEQIKCMESIVPSKNEDEKKQSQSTEQEVVLKLGEEEKNINMDLIYKIVKEVLAQSIGITVKKSFEKEYDPSGSN